MENKGRPTKYDRKYIAMADVYLEDCQDEFSDYHKTMGEKSDSYVRVIDVKLPTIEGFALILAVSKKTLYNWAEKHEDFLHSLEKIKAEQKKRLLNSGLSGDYNPTIAKLILSSNHGMTEKTDVTSAGKELNQVLVKFIDEPDNKDSN